MKVQFTKIAFVVFVGFALCFAQEVASEKIAVYAFGASDASINKSMSSKLLAAMVQSGTYKEIGDPASFQNELAKSKKNDLTFIVKVAKKYGSDYVCAVNITEVFGTHSIVVRLIKVAGPQIVKTSSADHLLKSLEDLTAVSNELASQLLIPVAAPLPHIAEAAPPPAAEIAHPPVALETPQQDTTPPPLPPPSIPQPSLADILAPVSAPAPVTAPAPAPVPASVAAPVPAPLAAQKQCAKTYNINELLFKIKNGFPSQLKDCSSTLAKDMLNPFGKKLEPKSFMTQCPIDGMKKELPEGFPGTDKVLGSLTNFVQGLINSASAGGALDPKKLVSAVASMNVDGLLSEVKNLSAGECVVDEPYILPTAPMNVAPTNSEKNNLGSENSNSTVSFGIRTGFNLSHTRANYRNIGTFGNGSGDYGDIFGIQFGFVLDIAASNWLYIQPGFMYVQKGRKEKDDISAHYLEFPFLLSLKPGIIPIRLNAGPYIGLCLSSDADIFDNGFDIGLNMGIGFDIDMFYIGAFYDYGFANMSKKSGYDFYNRTLGFNLGVNL